MPPADPIEILVLSDTHLSDAARLPAEVFEAAARADHIVHAGDHSSAEVIDVLATFAPVTAVRGNVEEAEVVARLPEVATLEVGGARLGVLHDAGLARGRHERLQQRLPGCDVRIYGHSHMPEVTQLADGSWVLNPGSPTQRRRAPDHTFGWVRLAGDSIAVELVRLPMALVLLCAAMVVLAGCGDSASGARSTAAGGTASTTSTTGASSGPGKPGPTAEQVALRQGQDALLRAYAPVTADVNEVASVVQLRDANATSAQAVRARAIASRKVLAGALERLGAVRPAGLEVRELRRLMLLGVRTRLRALDSLEAWAAPGPENAPAALVNRARYERAWESSVGTARMAMNLLQVTRERALLAPRREDAIR